jgi:Mg/Co/Ni transporter MgtE
MTRVTNIDSGQVYTTGLLNMRRFEQRSTETLVMGQMLDRRVTIRPTGVTGTVYDVGMEQARNRDWVLSRVAVQEPSKGFRRRGQTYIVEWRDVEGLARHEETQGATHLIAALNEMRPADAANMIHDLPLERRAAVVAALDDERLAEVLEELPEEDQVDILEHLDSERAADVLEEMSPDDAADLIADLNPETAATLLGLMEPGEAEDVRRLMSYEEQTAGAMMTPEPVILSPDATIADALAHVRNPELTPALAALVYVCRQPLETPTGRLLGAAHIQRLLREPPSTLVAAALDESLDPLRPDATIDEVAAHLATYNLVAAPVVDDEGRLLGAVTVDDLLDHMLPENWRDQAVRPGPITGGERR